MKCQCLLILALSMALTLQMIALGQSNHNLSVSIEPHKSTLLLGEPLFVTAEVKNQGQQSVLLVTANGPSYERRPGMGCILIAKEKEDFRPWTDGFRPLVKSSPVELAAGQEITNEYVILYSHSTGFAFPTPGNYQINIEYVMKSGQYQYVRGNPVLITVLEPEGENALMWKNLQNERGYGLLIQTPWDTRIDRAVIEDLIAVYDQNVNSVYKQYLGLNIGRYYIARNEDSQAALFLQSASINTDSETLRKMISREIEIINQRTLQARVTLKPEALNVSPGILTAFVSLPAGYPVSGITTATCDRARYERMMLNDDATEMIIKFRRQDIEAALAQIGESIDTNFVVRGVWQGAAGTNLFQGADSITKIVGAK